MSRAACASLTLALWCSFLFLPDCAEAEPAQTPGAPDDIRPLTWVYDGGFLRDLPTSDNLFTVLETLQPSAISDRFSGGGLDAGQPARVGKFLSSWTQTAFHIDGVPFTDPTGHGAPMLFPELVFWNRMDVGTGLFRADTDAAGISIDLMPRAPTDRWLRRAEGSISHSGLAGGVDVDDPAPAIARLDGWDRATIVATGPLVRNRIGAMFGASISRSAQFSRGEPFPSSSNLASALAHAVLTPNERDIVRVLGWIQQRKQPLRERNILGEPRSTAGHTGGHAQAVWERRQSLPWRAYASYSGRRQTPEFAGATSGITERLVDGPVAAITSLSQHTVQAWSVGATVRPTMIRRSRMHLLDLGFDTIGGRIESSSFFSGAIGELVHHTPARVWSIDSPPDRSSLRRSVTFGAFVNDRVMATNRLSLDLGLRYEAVTGSARNAETGISWQNVLPRAAARWSLSVPPRTALFGGYTRSAHRLSLDYLAIGDPAAPTVDVFRWNALAGGALPLFARGPLIARGGPGTDGDPAFSAIDVDLRRPTADELAIGIETRPHDRLLLRLTGLTRTTRNLPAVVNVGASGAGAYFSFPVENPDVVNPAEDNGVLNVFNRLPASFGRDRYVLTTPSRKNASLRALEADVQFNTSDLTLMGSVATGSAKADAASIGFGPTENDAATLGEIFANPNAEELARGRPFTDRAYVMKFAGVYRFSAGVRLGVVVRHQGGQPIAHVVVFPGLTQGADAVRTSPNGGRRLSSTSTADARLQKTFAWGGRAVDAFADVFNVLGLSQVVEQDIASISTPVVTALQPPRTIHIGLRVTF